MSNDSNISSLVDLTNILLVQETDVTKNSLINRLVEISCQGLNSDDRQEILERVLKRESSITTTLDTGLSIPHCRVDEASSFRAALAVIPAGIKDPLADNTDIKTMFLFISPANPAFFQKHLQILAELSEKFKDTFIAELTKAKTTEEILQLIKK